MAVRSRNDDLTGKKLSQFPYPYNTDLHWLWGWAQRVEANINDDEFSPSEHDWIYLRADQHAADAMLAFSIDYPALRNIR